MMTKGKACMRCGGPYWELITHEGIDVHNLGDCIEFLKVRLASARADVLMELDKRYSAMSKTKIDAAVDHMQKQLDQLETKYAELYTRNQRLEIIKAAAGYCFRNGHIDEAAILFTGLDKALEALEK